MSQSRAERAKYFFDSGHIRQDLKKKAVHGATGAVLSQFSVYLIQTVGVILLARILSPEDFGLVAMVTSFDVFVRMFRNLGLMDAIVQREDISHEQVSTLFWINAGFGVFLAGFFSLLAPAISWFYHEPRLVLIGVLISVDYVMGGISTQHRALMKRSLQMYRWGMNEIAATAIAFTVAIVLALRGWGYWAIVARTISFAVAQAVGAWLLCPWVPGLPRRGAGVRPMLRFGRDMLGTNFLNFLAESFDKILVGKVFGAQSLGYYTRAYHLFLAPAQQLTVPCTSVAVATLSRLVAEPAKYASYYLNAVEFVAFLGFPISGLMAVSGPEIVYLLLGSRWGEAGQIFSVFALGAGVLVISSTNAWLHLSLGRADRFLRWNAMAGAATSIAFLVGAVFGPTGMAASYTCAIYLLAVPGLWYAGQPMGLNASDVLSRIWRYFAAAVISGALCWVGAGKLSGASAPSSSLQALRVVGVMGVTYAGAYLVLVVALHWSAEPLVRIYEVVRSVRPQKR